MEKLKQEIWKKIPNHIGYEVSNLGRIRSYYNNGGKLCKEPHILRTIETEKGYIRVPIRKNKKPRIWFLHRLVLITFKGESILECNHKNGIKNDNRLENLEWVSHSENEKHAYKNNLKSKKGINHHANKLTEEDVIKIKYKEIGSLKNIAIKYGVTGQQIANIKSGKSWSHIR